MKNTEWYFAIVGKYRRGLNEINAKFDRQIEKKAGYAGSARYETDLQKINGERAGEIEALRYDCSSDFDRCLSKMQTAAQNRPAVAPTDEQMRLVQLLKLKESVTRDDLTHAALACEGCPLALGVLEEIAAAHDILGFHAGGNTLSDQFVKDAIQALARSARTLLSLDRTNQRGKLWDPTSGGGQFGTMPSLEATAKFRVDVDPESAQDCIGHFGGVSWDAYKAFAEATGE